MRVRFSFAIAFLLLLLFSSYLGLLPNSSLPSAPEAARPYIPQQSGRILHFVCFFALTAVFYFIIDTTRRRLVHLTLVVCTLLLSVGSEVVQGLLPNDREFDVWDVVANVVGSLCALGLASAYHRRAAERRRRAKYSALAGQGEDVELGEGVGIPGADGDVGRTSEGQETGVVAAPQRSVEEELDHWDENAPDDGWDEDDDATTGPEIKMTPATSSVGSEDVPKKLAVD